MVELVLAPHALLGNMAFRDLARIVARGCFQVHLEPQTANLVLLELLLVTLWQLLAHRVRLEHLAQARLQVAHRALLGSTRHRQDNIFASNVPQDQARTECLELLLAPLVLVVTMPPLPVVLLANHAQLGHIL